MLSKKIEEILNQQIEREAYSSSLYLAMASWSESNGFEGTSQWLYLQSDEERMHLLKFIKYLNERGGHALIPEIKQPPVDYQSVKDLFGKVLEHEHYISKSINEIIGVCYDEKDFTTINWLQWFVTEQIEEEASVRSILDKLSMIDEKNFYLFDKDVVSMRPTQAKAV